MASVTSIIKKTKQPRDGYLNINDFNTVQYNDDIALYSEENISYIITGLAVDYMVRYCMGAKKEEAFRISLEGARLKGELQKAEKMLHSISGLDDKSVIMACKLSEYDVYRRCLLSDYEPKENKFPDKKTISNISTMVKRGCIFFEKQGGCILNGFNFEGGYTDKITSGDGDYLTKDTLIEFKVSKKKPDKNHTLQTLIYYLMGYQSNTTEFNQITRLGIFNPRLNIFYYKHLEEIDIETISKIAKEVIGYQNMKENDNIRFRLHKNPKYITDMYGTKS